MYEKHHCTEPGAWLRHAAGIRTLLKLCGLDAHVYGFGRALYLAYRNLLITHALITGEACFLEEPDDRLSTNRLSPTPLDSQTRHFTRTLSNVELCWSFKSPDT